jgi:hypothetical protein
VRIDPAATTGVNPVSVAPSLCERAGLLRNGIKTSALRNVRLLAWAPVFICFQSQNAATTKRATEITKSERLSCITVPNPVRGKWGRRFGAPTTPCRAIEILTAGTVWAVSASYARRFNDIAASQSLNETRSLSLMSALRVNSGTGCASYWLISLLKAEAFSRSRSRSPIAA